MGEGPAQRSGIRSWANIHCDHSERDVQKVVEKQGTRLNVPLTYLELQDERIPWIDPRDWMEFIVGSGLYPMFAGLGVKQRFLAAPIWKDFWDKFEKLNPHHPIFELDLDWGRTVGLYIHGDEGRTLKKSGFMVTSIQSCLGKGFDDKRLKRGLGGHIKPEVNFAGHTFTTRFVSFVMPKTLYDKKPEIYHDALQHFSRSLQTLLDDGVRDPYTKELYKFVVLGCKGDLPYLAKTGYLNRTFNSGAKRGATEKIHGICHLCLAGFPNYPAEEVSSCEPAWLATVGLKLPWSKTPPFIEYLHHDCHDPATFFLVDLWHCVHLGFGRSWVASVVNLILEFLPQSNLDLKWNFLTEHYIKWCRDNKKQAHVSKVTAYLMSYDDKTGKQGRWHKGALTTNFCKWLLKLLDDVEPDASGFVDTCKFATGKLNAMFTCFYQGGFFLERNEAIYTADCGMQFLSSYADLAKKQFGLNRPSLFPLYPKLHLMHHAMLKVRSEVSEHGFAINPMATSCQMDEDTIGRVSRLSRRVSIRLAMDRTMRRYLIQCYDAWTSAGLVWIWWCDLQQKVFLSVGERYRIWMNIMIETFTWYHIQMNLYRYQQNQKIKKPGFFWITCGFAHDQKKEGIRLTR